MYFIVSIQLIKVQIIGVVCRRTFSEKYIDIFDSIEVILAELICCLHDEFVPNQDRTWFGPSV